MRRNKMEEIRQQPSKFKKRNRIIAILLLPVLVICCFVGLSLYWTSDRKHMSKTNTNRYEDIRFNVLLSEEEYAKQ